MEKEFSYSVFLMLCLFPETIGFSLQTTQTCGVIGKEFILVGNFTGDLWNPSSTREWRGPPSLTLLLSGGAIQPGISGYTETIDSAATDSIFKLHIQSLAWSDVDVVYRCLYRFGSDTFTINSNIVEDYSTTNDVITNNTNGKNILATITLNAIRPVPTVTALLNSPSGGSDITTQAITITSTPDTSNAKLNVVNINVNYTLSGNGGNVTVNLATPCGYAKSYTFKEDVETTTAATTNGSDNGSGLSEGAIAGIVIAVVVVCGVVVCVIAIVIFKKKKNKGPILPCFKWLDDKDKEKLHNNCSEGPSDDNCSENGKGKHPWKSSVEPSNTSGDTKDITKDETRNSPTSALSKSGVDVQIPPSSSDTPRRLQPIATTVSVTNNQEEKFKNKKKKKKKQAKQEQNQQQQEGKDNTGFDNDQTENIPSDDTSNPETKTTPSNNDKIPSDDTSNPETKTTPSNNDNLHSDDLGDPEMTTPNNNDKIPSDDPANPETTTPNNNDKIPSDDPANLETKTTPSNNDNLHSDDLGDPETATPSNNDNIPSDDPGNKETTTPSNNHNIPSDDSGNPETTTPSNIDT